MSLNLGIRRTKPKHRASDKVALLRDENRRLLTQVVGAGDHIALLEGQLADVRAKRAEAEQVVVCLDADVRDLADERDQQAEEIAELRRRLAPLEAAEANANAITVPPMVRDTTAFEDQATAPIDVRPLWDVFGIGPVINPGHGIHAH
ncbi:hypothetical protein [Streptomyces sp. 4R-3d]|uniref:hypothetical protein n=1 Tax=Streptomyces sp. 4R-3d TaxID=2559605 RepID=UPI001072E802|nr:hypothetical protein [Streptomyces sp. 4R-3d]TFI30094.1 hypothetical protein E4P36_04920 [Streptomyces sp. 4R-3d]